MPDQSMPNQSGPDQSAPDQSAPDRARQRLRRAFLSPTRKQLVVAVVLALVGFAAVTQVNANRADDTYAGYRQQDLIDVFSGLSATYERASREVAGLERAREDLETNTRARRAALEQAEGQAAALAVLAGTVPVTGPGVRITIEDQAGQVSIDSLLDLLQEVRTAGAEAVELNDQVRVVAQTFFEVGADGIVVDGEPVAAPYVMDVIGEPRTLAGAVDFFRGPLDTMEADEGAVVTVEELDALDIESVRESAAPEFAQPLPGAAGSGQ